MFNVQFAMLNTGRATARDLLVNYEFMNLGNSQIIVVADAPKIAAHPQTSKPLWILKIDHIHPGDVSYHGLTLHPPAGLEAIDITYHVSMADARTRTGSLTIKLANHS